MSVVGLAGLVRVQFSDRPAFGSPYPEGYAAGHIDLTGDATGGGVQASFSTEGGFLYRLELLNYTRGDNVASQSNFITDHRWLTDATGLGANAFQLNWNFVARTPIGFTIFEPFPEQMRMLRRIPIGQTAKVGSVIIFTINDPNNTDTIAYDFDVIFSYWKTEALYRPGFMSSFLMAPEVPPI